VTNSDAPTLSKKRYFRVKNLEKWQHYKDRNPPWIKLHRDVLNDYAFSCLQDDSKLHLVMIWLLASQMDNRLPWDSDWIANRINANNFVDLDLFLSAGFIEIIGDDSTSVAT